MKGPGLKVGRVAVTLLTAITVATCVDLTASGPRSGVARLNVVPSFLTVADGPVVPLASVRFVVRRLPAMELVVDVVVPFPTDGASLEVDLAVPLVSFNDRFHLRIAAIDIAGDTAYVSSMTDVRPVASGDPAPPLVAPLSYTGPDTVVAAVTFGPRDTTLYIGDSTRLRATAVTSDGTPVPDALVRFTSRDTMQLVIRDATRLHARAATTGTWVIATTANGRRDSTRIAAIARPVRRGPRVDAGPDHSLTALGDTTRLAPLAFDENDEPLAGLSYSYRSLDSLIATVSAGLLTAHRVGSTGIVVSAEGASDTLQVTVTQVPASVSLVPGASTLTALGDSLVFSATVRDRNAFNIPGAPVAWSSTNPAVAGISAAGVLLAAGNGSTEIRATSGSLSAASSVTVAQAASSVVVTPGATTFTALGDSLLFSARVLDRNGHAVSGAVVSWSSGNPAVATVTSSGLVTAVANGAADVQASSGSLSAAASLTVAQAATSVVVTPGATTFTALGDSLLFSASVLDRNGHAVSGAVVTWSTGDSAVAAATSAGYARAVGNGSTTMTATSGAITGTSSLEVSQVVTSIGVAVDTVRLSGVGDTARIVPSPRDRNGVVATNATLAYATSDVGVATVSTSGLVTLLSSGTATITVTGGSTATTVHVIGGISVGAGVGWIRITPATVTMAVGDTVNFVADLIGPSGEATRIAPVWSSDVPARLSVSADGRAIAAQIGGAVVTATYSGLAGRATASITAAPVISEFSFAPRVLTGVTSNALTFSVSVTAADAGTGISSMQVTFTAPDGATRSCTAIAVTWGTKNRGGWDCAITIPAGSASGIWHASSVTLVGTITRNYGESVLSSFGGTTLEVRP